MPLDWSRSRRRAATRTCRFPGSGLRLAGIQSIGRPARAHPAARRATERLQSKGIFRFRLGVYGGVEPSIRPLYPRRAINASPVASCIVFAMTVKSDRWIRRMAAQGMIEPF